jgi:hypothetical protein
MFHYLPTTSLVLAVAVTVGCTNMNGNAALAIEVGAPYDDALSLLQRWDAQPTQLAMMPPTRSDGSYMELSCFMLDDERALSVVFDPQHDDEIVSLSLCEAMSEPKRSREWRRIDRYPTAR